MTGRFESRFIRGLFMGVGASEAALDSEKDDSSLESLIKLYEIVSSGNEDSSDGEGLN